MLKLTQDGIWQSNLLFTTGVIHGYSSRRLGDMRKREYREKFLSRLQLAPSKLIFSEQVHGSNVQLVTTDDRGKEIKGTDGLVYKKGNKPVSLAVQVADCVPIVAVDPETCVIGVAHAGWKGTLRNIASNLITTMKSQGAVGSRILVSIGPHIGMCCYSVEPDRAGQFADMFNNEPGIVSFVGSEPHLDLGYSNARQLLDAGIPQGHIDTAPTCTSCQIETYYSYRKDTKETFGEILGVIGYAR